MKPDREIVVCQTVDPGDGSPILCPDCLQKCWISAHGVELVATGKAEPLCVECSIVAALLEGAPER